MQVSPDCAALHPGYEVATTTSQIGEKIVQQKTITTEILDIAYLEYGTPDGWPCIMGHGFPTT